MLRATPQGGDNTCLKRVYLAPRPVVHETPHANSLGYCPTTEGDLTGISNLTSPPALPHKPRTFLPRHWHLPTLRSWSPSLLPLYPPHRHLHV